MISDFLKTVFGLKNIIRQGEIKWIQFLVLVFFYFVFAFCFVNIVNMFFDIPHNRNTQLLSYGFLKGVLCVGILYPVIEEISYRLWLRKSRINTIISLLCCVVILLYSIFKQEGIMLLLDIFVFSILCCVIFICTLSVRMMNSKVILYISSLIFGIMHITNFPDILSIPIYIIPLLILPQFLLGLVSGYLRLSYGFVYGILFHATINLVTLVFVYSLK